MSSFGTFYGNGARTRGDIQASGRGNQGPEGTRMSCRGGPRRHGVVCVCVLAWGGGWTELLTATLAMASESR